MDPTTIDIGHLLSDMSLAEKIGQMTQLTNAAILENPDTRPDGSPGNQFGLSQEKITQLIREYHIGSFLNGIAVSGEEWCHYTKTIQEINLKIQPHKIPILYGIDHMHGASYVANSTIFPHRINLAATFDPHFSAEEARIIGIESGDLGHPWIFAPVVDLGRNPRFPRFYETYGEDPLLCARMGAAFVESLQDNPSISPYRQAACAKHFIGYSDPKSGWDRSPAEISMQGIQEYFLPPFQALINAGVKTFMINGGEINGIPVHASQELLTDMLRGQLGFEGVVVTDWEDVIRLHTVHRVADSPKEAVYLAVMAGIDMSMTPFEPSFARLLIELVEEERIPEERIDQSVRRILTLKKDLGLFEHPFPRTDRLDRIRKPEHVSVALEAARESLVLLKNDKILPLDSTESPQILLSGPNAHLRRVSSGGWTLRWIPEDESLYPPEAKTIYEGLTEEFGDENVHLASRAAMRQKASHADVLVLAVGEWPYSEGSGNIYDLTLDKDQLDWVREAQQCGKPVILIVIAGRPRIIREVYADCAAVIWAGLPGYEGATALAELIRGKFNPSGRLPFSYPNWPGHFYPYYYKLMDLGHYQNFKASEAHMAPFGAGLSYSQYAYDQLELSHTAIQASQKLQAQVRIRNLGERDGKETVFWYIHDEYASITRPLKQLKHFEKVWIKAGEAVQVHFEIDPIRDLSFPDARGKTLLEKGRFRLMVGPCSAKFSLS